MSGDTTTEDYTEEMRAAFRRAGHIGRQRQLAKMTPEEIRAAAKRASEGAHAKFRRDRERLAALEAENAALRAENEALRTAKGGR